MSEAYVNALTLKVKAGKWLAEIAPFNEHKVALRARESALLVIDMQRGLPEIGYDWMRFYLNARSGTFDRQACRVIRRRVGLKTDGVEGSDLFGDPTSQAFDSLHRTEVGFARGDAREIAQ